MADNPIGTGTIKSPEHVATEEDRDRWRHIAEGWRTIGDTLLAAAIGFNMRGFGEIPPLELLEPIADASRHGATHDQMIATLRDSLLGQAWRVAGKDGKGGCDYPLCANRGPKSTPAAQLTAIILEAPEVDGPAGDGGWMSPGVIANRTRSISAGGVTRRVARVGTLHVCDGECTTWANWIAARSIAGRIQVK